MIVRENIQSFERGGDPISTMGIGNQKYQANLKILIDAKEFMKVEDDPHVYASRLAELGVKLERLAKRASNENEVYVSWEGPRGPNSRTLLTGGDTKHIFAGVTGTIREIVNLHNKVKESLYFERGQEPMTAMGIGRKPQILAWLYSIDPFIDNPVLTNNLRINADDVDLTEMIFNQFPEFVKFGEIHMDFKVFIRSSLALKAFPHYVGREVTVYYPNDVEKPCTVEDIRKICEVGGSVVVEHLD